MRSDAYSSRRDTVSFAICLLSSIALQLAPEPVTDEISEGLLDALRPFLWLQTVTEHLLEQRFEFATLKMERDSAAASAGRVWMLDRDNQRLRSILGLRARMPVHHVAGEILHQLHPTEETTLLVSLGERDGVRRWAPVVALGGLLGSIQQVGGETSVIHSWAHPDFRVGVTAMNDSVVGLVSPRLSDGLRSSLELRGVTYDGDIPVGTPVYTSGGGGVYPPGIPVGFIRSAVEVKEGWTRTLLLEPAVHPAAVSYVLVLLAGGDLSQAFPADRR